MDKKCAGNKRREQLDDLQEKIGIKIDNLGLLDIALTEPMYANEKFHDQLKSYQRLEFLGDAVLNLAVKEKLYLDNPDMKEGELTRLAKQYCDGKTEVKVATLIGLGDYVNKGNAAQNSAYDPSNMLEDTVESLIGAIYLDSGIGAVRGFVKKWFFSTGVASDPVAEVKGRLSEMCQARWKKTPSYDHAACDDGTMIVCEVSIQLPGSQVLKASSKAKSQREAEIAAADEAIKSWFN